MNYIYDIYLNFNNELYDFFDWNKTDNIIRIKKIPIIKISNKQLKLCINNKIKISNKLFNNILKKTDCFNKKAEALTGIILTDGSNALALEFNNKRISVNKSSLQLNDELDILEFSKALQKEKFNFTIFKKNKPILKTRKQLQIESFVIRSIKNIDDTELSFIYYECFNKKSNNRNNLMRDIKTSNNSPFIYEKIFNILKLSSKNKNKML